MSAPSLKISNTGSWTSVLLGSITGLIGVALCFFGTVLLTEMITDDTLSAIAIFAVYSHPTIGLATALLPTLWFTGHYAERRLVAGDKTLNASFKYCLITNLVVWSVFSIVFFLSPLSNILGLVIPFCLFFLFLVLSTFTIGMIVCSIIRKRILKRNVV